MRRLHGSRHNARIRGLRRRRSRVALHSRSETINSSISAQVAPISDFADRASARLNAIAGTVKSWKVRRPFGSIKSLIIAGGIKLSEHSMICWEQARAVAQTIGTVAGKFVERLGQFLRLTVTATIAAVTAFAIAAASSIRRLTRFLTQDRLPDVPGGDPLTFGVLAGVLFMLVVSGVIFVIELSIRPTEPIQVASIERQAPVRPPVRITSPIADASPLILEDLEAQIETDWVYAVEEPAEIPENSVLTTSPEPEAETETENLVAASPLLVTPEARPDDLTEPEQEVALIPIEPEPAPGTVGTLPPWLANAVPVRKKNGPMIAIVIDDAGVARERTARAINLPPPLTIAFIPYSRSLERQTRHAHRQGHELMLHIPMEPGSGTIDPGPNALLTTMSHGELMRRLRWAMDRFDGYVGINNHMGSKFTSRADLMEPLLAEMNHRGYLFLDSRTDRRTQGAAVARGMGMPHASRDVFLDNELDREKIEAQLAQVERIARRKGHAIAIGHPHDVTIDVLARWIPEARKRGFNLVPISAIVKQEFGEDARLATAAGSGKTNGFLGSPE